MEIKLGGNKLIEEGVANIKKLRGDLATGNPPTLMLIITVMGAAYRRNDGVYVVPLNCLRA